MSGVACVEFVRVTKKWLSDPMIRKVESVIVKAKKCNSFVTTYEVIASDDSKLGLFIIATQHEPSSNDVAEIIQEYVATTDTLSDIQGIGIREMSIKRSKKPKGKTRKSQRKSRSKNKAKKSARRISTKGIRNKRKKRVKNTEAKVVDGVQQEPIAKVRSVKAKFRTVSDKLNVPIKNRNRSVGSKKLKKKSTPSKRTKTTGQYHNLFSS